MNGTMNENQNQLTIVKQYEIIKPLIHKIDSIIDNCIRDCHNKFFHFIHLKINVYMLFNLQILVILKLLV